MRLTPLTAAALVLAAAAAAPAQPPSSAISAAIADASRPAADKDRDAARKPAQALAFAGVKAGDKIADLIPGGGYFTRIFAKAVGPRGHVYAAVPGMLASRAGALDGVNAIASANPNVTVSTIDFAALKFPEPLDIVWTSENYHDFYNAPNADVVALNRAIFAALKPGGVYMVEDHAAAAGAGTSVTKTLHRIEASAAIKDIEAAGFKLDGRSTILANASDPHDKPVFDPAIRGKTDKFLLKFRKPK